MMNAPLPLSLFLVKTFGHHRATHTSCFADKYSQIYVTQIKVWSDCILVRMPLAQKLYQLSLSHSQGRKMTAILKIHSAKSEMLLANTRHATMRSHDSKHLNFAAFARFHYFYKVKLTKSLPPTIPKYVQIDLLG